MVGAPTGFFLGAGLPWACVVAFGVLAGFFTAFLLVSGITRNPHVNERMLSVYSIRFGFASQMLMSALKPTRFYFAFGSLHNPIVIARGLCCRHSSSVKMKSGTHMIKSKTSTNSLWCCSSCCYEQTSQMSSYCSHW